MNIKISVITALLLIAFPALGQKNIDASFDERRTFVPPAKHYRAAQNNFDNPEHYLRPLGNSRAVPASSLVPVAKQESGASRTHTYRQHINGIPVLDALVRVRIPFRREVSVSVTDSRIDPARVEIQSPFASVDSGVYYWSDPETLAFAKQEIITDDAGIHYLVLTDKNNDEILKRLLGAYSGTEPASAKVFFPNPITSANTAYGAPYTDNNDQTNSELDAQLKTVTIYVTDSSGIYKLENDHVKITEHSPPTIPPTTSNSGTFHFDRSQDEFEDVNAYYHISAYWDYLDQLGYGHEMNYAVEVDANGLFGSDQSIFTYSSNVPRITFGTGGVDDAEDADVIVHEYGHAVMHALAPETNVGTQRQAMDEGIGDYIAASYSKYSDPDEHDYRKVFNWDGHNEFWEGRMVESDKKYPGDLENDIYADAPMWSAALMHVEENIGRDITHQLLFESAYGYSTHMQMSTAAELFIHADSAITGGVHYPYLSHIFWYRGFIDTSYSKKPEDIVSVPEITPEYPESSGLRIAGSAGFAAGTAPAIITVPGRRINSLRIYTVGGKLVRETGPSGDRVEIYPARFKAGLYIISIRTETGERYTEKISRF